MGWARIANSQAGRGGECGEQVEWGSTHLFFFHLFSFFLLSEGWIGYEQVGRWSDGRRERDMVV